MDTDEYAISLSRELAVCRSTLKRIRKDLAALERKHGISTQDLIVGGGSTRPTLSEDGIRKWRERHDALLRWQVREAETEQLYRLMKGQNAG